MHNIRTQGISEGKATDAIFDACRANEKREPRGNVRFKWLADGTCEAALRNADGVVVALAIVDEFDC